MLNLGDSSTCQQSTNNMTDLWQQYVHVKVVKGWDHWDSSLSLIFTSSSLSTDVLRWGCSWKGFEVGGPGNALIPEERKHLPELGGINLAKSIWTMNVVIDELWMDWCRLGGLTFLVCALSFAMTSTTEQPWPNKDLRWNSSVHHAWSTEVEEQGISVRLSPDEVHW